MENSAIFWDLLWRQRRAAELHVKEVNYLIGDELCLLNSYQWSGEE